MQLPNLLWLNVFVTLGSVGNIWHALRSGCLRSNRTFTTVTEVEHELDADGRIDAKPCFSSRALVINLWLRLDAKSSNKIVTPQAKANGKSSWIFCQPHLQKTPAYMSVHIQSSQFKVILKIPLKTLIILVEIKLWKIRSGWLECRHQPSQCWQARMFINRLYWKPTWDNEISSPTFCLSVVWLMSDCSSGCVGGDEISRKCVSNDLREAAGRFLEYVNSSSAWYGKANKYVS